MLEERDNWMVIQNWLIAAWLQDVFEQWLEQAMLNSQVKTANGATLPIAKLDKFKAGFWLGRRWAWVDPTKDAEAAITLINAGLKSRRDVMNEAGRDLEETWAQLQSEQQMAEQMGIALKQQDNQVQSPPAQ